MSIVAIAGAAALWVGLKRGTLSLVLPLIRRMPVIERRSTILPPFLPLPMHPTEKLLIWTSVLSASCQRAQRSS
jgi:hypothetical protein